MNINIFTVTPMALQVDIFKVEYHANENPLTKSEKIAYIGQRLLYPIIKKNIIPYDAIFF